MVPHVSLPPCAHGSFWFGGSAADAVAPPIVPSMTTERSRARRITGAVLPVPDGPRGQAASAATAAPESSALGMNPRAPEPASSGR